MDARGFDAHERRIAGYVGRSGSGKTHLIKVQLATLTRVIIWDWRGEYVGPIVTRAELPALFRRRSFTVRIRPAPWISLFHGFAALAHVVCKLGDELTVICDEVALVTPDRKEGGIGHILRYARPQRIGLLWATQRPTGIPGILLAETRTLYCFHCDARADLSALNGYLSDEELRRVATLPPRAYVTVHK